jgi:hypothetical protein
MINYRADRAVSGAVEVWWAVWGAIDNRDVRDVVYDALGGAVRRTVDEATYVAVHRAVAVDGAEYTAVSALGPEHPALQDFLRG